MVFSIVDCNISRNSGVVSPSPISFPLTEHGERVDDLARDCNTFRSFSPIELKERKLSVLSGKLVIGKQKMELDSNGCDLMYLMNRKRKIYVERSADGKYYHSSFLNENEDWPIAAGMLRVCN